MFVSCCYMREKKKEKDGDRMTRKQGRHWYMKGWLIFREGICDSFFGGFMGEKKERVWRPFSDSNVAERWSFLDVEKCDSRGKSPEGKNESPSLGEEIGIHVKHSFKVGKMWCFSTFLVQILLCNLWNANEIYLFASTFILYYFCSMDRNSICFWTVTFKLWGMQSPIYNF